MGNVPWDSPNQGKIKMCQLKEGCHREEVLHAHIMVLGLKAALFSSSGYFLPGCGCLQGTSCLVFQRICRAEMEIANWVHKYDADMAEKQVSTVKCFALPRGAMYR